MDPITHAASGALLALSFKERPATALAVPLAALASAAPDVDVFFSPSPLDFLLLHRGITHALPALPLMGLVLALCMFPWWRKATPGHWSFGKTYILAMLLVLLHIWLDCVTTYGTMIFLPFSEYRVRLNGIFIVDLLLFVPMLAALWYGRKLRAAAVAGLIWVFLYPGACVGLRMMHQHTLEARLAGQQAREVTVLPDALAPLFWRVIYATDSPYSPYSSEEATQASGDFYLPKTASSVHHQGLDWRGQPRTQVVNYPAAGEALTRSLAGVSTSATAFFDFCLLPVQQTRSLPGGEEEFRFYDLRFATMLPFVQSIMNLRNNGEPSFLLEAQKKDEQWKAVRMRFSGASRDSSWHSPDAPHKPAWWQWLVGLR